MSIFKKSIKKNPNIDFVFLDSKTPLHVTNSLFFHPFFFKICPFLQYQKETDMQTSVSEIDSTRNITLILKECLQTEKEYLTEENSR